MATRTYNGTDGNWTNTANWSGATVPTTNDIVVIPKVANDITLDTNLDASAKDFAAIIVQKGSNVTIGTSGNPLKCACSGATLPGIIRHEGAKAFYLKAEHASLDILQVECNSNNQVLAMQIDDDGTAQILKARLLKGKLTTTAGITSLPYIEVGRRDNPDGDANLLVETHASNVLTLLVMNAGTARVKREFTDIVIVGGRLVVDGAEPGANLFVGGGTVDYDSTGTLAMATVFAGLLDFTKTWKAKVVTTLRGIRPGHIRLHDAVAVTNSEYVTGVATFDSAGSGSTP